MSIQRVLIVEDDSHSGGQLSDLFEFQNYEVGLFSTGQGVAEAVASQQFDVAIIDLVLPGIGGVDLVRQIRKSPAGKTLPVFMISAVYREPRMFERELRELGVVEFLPKPFAPIDLGRKVDALLNSGKTLDESAARVTRTGSWRLEELQEVLGEGPTQLGSQVGFDRRSLLDTFVDIFRRHAVGCLVLHREEVRREIYFLNGYPVAATSHRESESLGHFVRQMGLVDAASLENVERAALLEGTSLREMLLSRGLVRERKLRRAERARLEHIVINTFDWSTGTSEFVTGEALLKDLSINEVNPVTCLAKAVRKYFTSAELRPALESRMGHVLSPGPRYGNLVSYLPLPEGLNGLLDEINAGVSIRSLFNRFGAETDALVWALWLMLNLGVVNAEESTTEVETEWRGELSAALQQGADSLDSDYYAFLGVERDVVFHELEAARTRLEIRYRQRSGDPRVDERLQQLQDRLHVCFSTLSDPAERQRYDQRLAALETGEWTWPISKD